jgi:hypothetical protein
MKIWAKTDEFHEGKFLVVRRDGSVPHWPHFVLGARDPVAASSRISVGGIFSILRPLTTAMPSIIEMMTPVSFSGIRQCRQMI